MGRRAHLAVPAMLIVGLFGCSNSGGDRVDPAARVVTLPGAGDQIDFDDIVFSPRLNRLLVPARDSGLYLVEPDSGDARRLYDGDVASVDDGPAGLFVGDRTNQKIVLIDPANGHVVTSVATSAPPDYIRYVAATHELWVTEPGASRIEVLTVADATAPRLHRDGFVAVPDGPEGLAVSASQPTAYTHAGDNLVAVDLARREVKARWNTGCDGTHGFPRVDDRDGFVLASCAGDGTVVLLDLHDGHRLGHYSGGGGEALPAYSPTTGHFYVRSDPGTTIATLVPTRDGLRELDKVRVPEAGHCLTADTRGHYWTCDADHGRILRFDDRSDN